MRLSLIDLLDRLYLASYTHPPNAQTPFPYPTKATRSPSKRSSRAQQGPTAVSHSSLPPVYFSIDKHLLYNAFHADFGPLHIGHLYRFAVMLHEVLGDSDNENRPVVFWSNADSRSKPDNMCQYVGTSLTRLFRSRQLGMHSGLLHDSDPKLAPTSCFGSHRSNGSSVHAFP